MTTTFPLFEADDCGATSDIEKMAARATHARTKRLQPNDLAAGRLGHLRGGLCWLSASRCNLLGVLDDGGPLDGIWLVNHELVISGIRVDSVDWSIGRRLKGDGLCA